MGPSPFPDIAVEFAVLMTSAEVSVAKALLIKGFSINTETHF